MVLRPLLTKGLPFRLPNQDRCWVVPIQGRGPVCWTSQPPRNQPATHYRRFAPARPTSCVLTKVDEAVTLGGMLSVLIRARLPIAYVSDGQRVPEDLRPARAEELIATAVQLAQTNGAAADEDLLKRRFGDVAHALA